MINLRQLFCWHDYMPFRTYIYKQHGVKRGSEEAYNLMTVEGVPDTTYRVVIKEVCYPWPDSFCPKCKKYKLNTTNWLVKQEKKYKRLADKLTARTKTLAEGKQQALQLLEDPA